MFIFAGLDIYIHSFFGNFVLLSSGDVYFTNQKITSVLQTTLTRFTAQKVP